MTSLKSWLRDLFAGQKESVSTPKEPVATPSVPQAQAPPGGPKSLAPKSLTEDNSDFALAMYGQLREQPGNLFFSPFSIRTALGMTLAGARGETAAQMREALCVSSSDEELHAACAEIIKQLNAASGDRYEMTVANSLWGQDGVALQPDFLDLIAQYYGGGMQLVDFRRQAEAARATMNEWVEDKTKKKIRELIPHGGVDADTRLVLINAVYFKGTWVFPFRTAATRDDLFFLENGGKVQVPLMHQQEEIRYMQGAGYQAVDLAYSGSRISLLVLLPDRKDGLRDLERTLSAQLLHDCVSQLSTREVKLYLPRFKITWGTVNLRNLLADLGMRLAFTRGQADFSGINGLQPPDEEALFLAAVFHKAFVEVNEAGTEAAAATAVTSMMVGAALMPVLPPPIPIFRADHPFLFAIRDRLSRAILFLGRVADPTREI